MSYKPGISTHIISAANSTQSLLGISATFTGAWEDVTNYTTVSVSIIGSYASAKGTLYFDVSHDGGATITSSIPRLINDITFDKPHVLNVVEQYVRIRYVNGLTAQTGVFGLQTKYSNAHQLGLNNLMGDTINAETEGQVVKSVTTAQDPTGSYVNIKANGQSFSTSTPLGISGTYTSSVISLLGYTQVQAIISADQDGTFEAYFYADLAGTDLVRSITVPYETANGASFLSAPAFTPYVKYVFTNGTVAQTDFFFEVKLTTTAISPQILDTQSFIDPKMTASLFRTVTNPSLDRNLGRIGGQSVARKFGVNESVSNTAFETIWDGADNGGATTYTFPQVAETLRVKAGGNVNDDNSGGTGARTVQVDFLDSNWEEQSETLTLAGASASAATTSTAYRVLRVKVLTSGTYGENSTGIIIIENTTSGDELAYITADYGITKQSVYTVPANKTLYLTKIKASVGAGNSADLRLFGIGSADDFSAPYTSVKRFVWGVEDYEGANEFNFETYLKFDEKTDIIADAKRITGSGTARVSFDFEFILIDN